MTSTPPPPRDAYETLAACGHGPEGDRPCSGCHDDAIVITTRNPPYRRWDLLCSFAMLCSLIAMIISILIEVASENVDGVPARLRGLGRTLNGAATWLLFSAAAGSVMIFCGAWRDVDAAKKKLLAERTLAARSSVVG
jgi:hypothetical protein